MFNKYKEMCKKLKINFKKDFSLTLSIFLIMIIASITLFFFYSYITLCLGIMCSFLYLFTHFENLKASLKQLTNAKEIAFNGFYRYVVTLLTNGNVLYSALQMSTEYVDNVLVDDVNELIADIENDTSIEPFFKFMSNFNDESIKQMILLLYKTQEVGIINDVLDSINESMINLQDNSISNYISKEEKNIERFYMVPILLSALVMVFISLYIFSLIGEGIYV